MTPEELIQLLTMEEKVSLLSGADLWSTTAIPRLGIPSLKMTDGPYGTRGAAGKSGPPAACFPVGVAMAATFNLDLVEDLGRALGEEARDKEAHILLGPTANIQRTPLAGRNFECFSEDPYLTSRMAIAYIRGVQSQGVGTCIKHFVCNEAEFERYSMSSEVPERALQEVYLAPFRAAVREARPWAVMSAYNRLNGVSCSENPRLLNEILKAEWSFAGLVVSDWTGTYSDDVATAGLDLEMPGPGRWMGKRLVERVQSGEIPESILDDKVLRLLRTIEKASFSGNERIREIARDRPKHRRLIRTAGAEAIVLLKNANGLLPLDASRLRSIAVIGESASKPAIMGGGSSEVTPHYAISLLEAIREEVGEAVQVEYAVGCHVHRSLPLMDFNWLKSEPDGQKGLLVEFFLAPDFSGGPVGQWFTTRPEITFADSLLVGVQPERFSARLSGEFSVPLSGRYRFGLSSNLNCRLLIDGDVQISNQGRNQGADSTLASGHFAGVMLLEAGRRYSINIEATWEGSLAWRELAIRCEPPVQAGLMEQAVALAGRADVVILAVGLNKEWESEGFDRPDLHLPGEQEELVQRVLAVNSRTVVVLSCGSPLEMPWLEDAAGVLQAWYLGQESGHAIADVLFGRQAPGGRLPVTFPMSLQDNPTYLHYPGENGRHLYAEGIFTGYRYYQLKAIQPLFPFGFGLSYTSFSYRELQLEKDQIGRDGCLRASIVVTNTGLRGGSEVVQWYVHHQQPILRRPDRWLAGFSKIALQPGESRRVELELPAEELAYYDDLAETWVVEPGEYRLMAGSSCEQIHLQVDFQVRVEVDKELQPSFWLGHNSTLGELLADENARQVLRRHLGGLVDHPLIEMALGMNLEQIAGFVPEMLTKELLEAIAADLAKDQ